jgi:hypothetical protein
MKTTNRIIDLVLLLTIVLSFYPVSALEDPFRGQAIMALAIGEAPDCVLAEINAWVIDSIPGEQIFLISFPEDVPVQAIIDSLLDHSGVLFAEPNYRAGMLGTYQASISFPDENAPAFEAGNSPADFYEQTALATIGADSAQQLSLGDEVQVAIIDIGVDLIQPLLDYVSMMPGYDFVDDDADPTDDSGLVYGHGTFVSGLVALMAPDCQQIPIRAFDSNGHGNGFALAQAIHYSIDHGADVVHVSFGMYDSSLTLNRACSIAVAAGLTMVASSGNNASDAPSYPASLPGIIAVSAIDTLDLLAEFSSFGNFIDVCVPGVNLYSALAGEYAWGTWDGTPFAAALVSATCALVLTLDSSFSAVDMEEHIRATATRELQWGTVVPPDIYYGYGRLDAGSAVWGADSILPRKCGDANGDDEVNVGDAVFLISYIFKAGPPPDPICVGDANGDDDSSVGDAVCIINYIFKSGPPPVEDCCL